MRLVGLRIWNEREARRNECETRCWLTLERVRNLLRSHSKVADCPFVAGRDVKSQSGTDSLTLNPWFWRANRLNHNGRCSASFALISQNAALEAQLISQQNIAQGLAELPGALTTVLNRSQAPTRRMLVDPKGLGKPPVFSGREEHFYVWAKKVENYVSPNVRGALTFAAESQDVVTAATVAIGVPELGVETSEEVDGQLFVVLSAFTDDESFDVIMSAGGDHGFESRRKLHGRWNPYTAGRARSLLREILSPTQAKLPELMGAIEKMEGDATVADEMPKETLLRKTFA